MREFSRTSIPTKGKYMTGDIVFNISESDTPGWVCVEGGEPGKWEPLSIIGDKIIVSKKTSNGITVELLQNQKSGMYTIKASTELYYHTFTNEIEKFYTLDENEAICKLIDVVVEFEKEDK